MRNQIALITALMVFSASAHADMILMLDDGMGNVVTIADGGAGDINPDAGVVSFSGALGSFIVNVSTGISFPVLGSALEPILHLNSVDVSNGAGTLIVALTTTDFMGPIGNNQGFLLGVGGVTDGTVSVESFMDSTNTAFGTQTALGSTGGSGGAFSSAASGTVDIPNSPFSLSIFTTIEHDRFGVSSFDADLRIPEPATLAIFGLGLLLIGFSRRRQAAWLN